MSRATMPHAATYIHLPATDVCLLGLECPIKKTETSLFSSSLELTGPGEKGSPESLLARGVGSHAANTWPAGIADLCGNRQSDLPSLSLHLAGSPSVCACVSLSICLSIGLPLSPSRSLVWHPSDLQRLIGITKPQRGRAHTQPVHGGGGALSSRTTRCHW